jgi:hypothetical protein
MSNKRASDLLQTSCFACTCLQAVCRPGLTYELLNAVCEIVGLAVVRGVVQAGAGVVLVLVLVLVCLCLLLCCSCL